MLSESGQSIVTLSKPPHLRDPTATLRGATGRPLDVYVESRQRRRSAFLGKKRRKQSTPNEARGCLMRVVASPEVKSVDSQALMVAGLPRRTALEMCHEFMAKSANLIVGAGREAGILFRCCTRMQSIRDAAPNLLHRTCNADA